MSIRIKNRPVDETACANLQQAGASPLFAKLFASRNIHSNQDLKNDFSALLPYTELTNCVQAGKTLADFVQQKRKILIVADYDADGATACSVGIRAIREMGGIVDFLVPNRFINGYGLTPELSQIAHQQGAQLLMTVDNGIASTEGVAKAQALGLEVIITDHHIAPDVLPDCLIVNPNQPNCSFSSKSLAGVGVIFYVMLALRAQLRERNHFSPQLPEPNLANLLDLVALGTVADVVALDQNNRILVTQGLNRMRKGKMNAGIRALFDIAKRDPRKAQAFDMGFALAPRINAAGRLDNMSIGINCLTTDDPNQAQQLAQQLNELNQARQEIEQGMLEHVFSRFPPQLPNTQATLVTYQDDFHQGVVGIVASRLKERFYRPTFVFAPAGNGQIRGSGRSIQGLHLRDALDIISKRHPDLILQFGGHAMAAGLTIRLEDLDFFRQNFERTVWDLINQDTLMQTYLTDGNLTTADITLERARELEAQIWGHGFPPPSFNDQFDLIKQQTVGNNHTKAWLKKDGKVFEAMFWRCNTPLPSKIHMVYRPVVNQWRDKIELQLYADYWETA